MRSERGFTIIEVLIAIVVLSVGITALVTSAALVTRMIASGQRSAVAAIFGQQRMEQLRPKVCASGVGTGADTLMKGGQRIGINTWTITRPQAGDSTYRIVLLTNYTTTPGKTRTDTLQSEVSCLI